MTPQQTYTGPKQLVGYDCLPNYALHTQKCKCLPIPG